MEPKQIEQNERALDLYQSVHRLISLVAFCNFLVRQSRADKGRKGIVTRWRGLPTACLSFLPSSFLVVATKVDDRIRTVACHHQKEKVASSPSPSPSPSNKILLLLFLVFLERLQDASSPTIKLKRSFWVQTAIFSTPFSKRTGPVGARTI